MPRFIYLFSFLSPLLLLQSSLSLAQHDAKDSIEILHKQIKEEVSGNTGKALMHAERALFLSKANKLDREELQSYYCFGLIYYYKSYYNISNDYYRLIVASPKSDKKQISAAWNNMGINFELTDQIDSALYAYQESRKIDKSLGDLKSENMVLINIGLLNYKLNRFDKALNQTHQAREYFEKHNDKENMALCYLNLGLIHGSSSPSDSSIFYSEKAANIYEQNKDYPNLIQSYLNISNYWILEKNKSKATTAFAKAKKYLKLAESPYYRATSYSIAGLIHSQFYHGDSSIYYMKKSADVYDSLGMKQSILEEYFRLAHEYVKAGKYAEYYNAINKYDSLNKKINGEDLNNRLAEMEVRYKLEMNNLQVRNTENLLSEKKTQIFVISMFTLALLVALLITYRLYIKVNSANKSLYEKNIELMGKEKKETPINPKTDNNSEENALLVRFEKLLLEQEFYKNPDLSLKMAATELGTNEKYLSQAVNTGNDNFSTYVNRFRVNAARTIILEEKDNQMSIEELGLMVGFTNRHTFSRAFVQITGISPSEFRKIHHSNQDN